jgi:Raf kinase inhibitor-like YbhB/YbcL family protein
MHFAVMLVLVLTSSTFPEGGTIPARSVYNGYGCAGQNMAPNLAWSGAPTGTRSFALTAFDPDAPAPGGWWHWVAFDIPARTIGLGSVSEHEARAAGTVYGVNSFGKTAYDGPCPPPGRSHHYVFTLYALDVSAVPGAGAHTTGPELQKLIEGHVLGKATLTGLYGR